MRSTLYPQLDITLQVLVFYMVHNLLDITLQVLEFYMGKHSVQDGHPVKKQHTNHIYLTAHHTCKIVNTVMVV